MLLVPFPEKRRYGIKSVIQILSPFTTDTDVLFGSLFILEVDRQCFFCGKCLGQQTVGMVVCIVSC